MQSRPSESVTNQSCEVVANQSKVHALGGLRLPKAPNQKVPKMANESKNTNNLFITSTESSFYKPASNPPHWPQDKEWGIDTCFLSIPVTSDVPELAQNSWRQTEGKQNEKFDKTTYVSIFRVGYGDVRVAYMPIYGSIFISFNAARIISRKSAELLPPAALRPLVERLLGEVVPQIPVMPTFMSIDHDGTIQFANDWTLQVKFTRLDCARNLYVDSPEYVKHALSKVKSKYQKTVHIYFDHEGWTRANQTKSAGIDRFYDKSAELRNLELEERFHWDKRVFRFESQLQGDRLTKYGLKTLDKVCDESVWNVLETRWDACGWDVPLPGEGSIDELLTQVPDKERLPFLGFLGAQSEGLSDLIDAKPMKKYAKLALSLGVVPGLPVPSYRPMTRRLSLWHGTCVAVD